MKKYTIQFSLVLFLLLGSIMSSCHNDQDIEVVPTNNIINKFALVDPDDSTKRINFEIDDTKKEIVGHIMKGLDVSNYIMDFSLGADVEALSVNGYTIPSNGQFIMRSQQMDSDFVYNINIVQDFPLLSFKISNGNDTISAVIDNVKNEVTAYFPTNQDIKNFKTIFETGHDFSCNLRSGENLQSENQEIIISQGNLYQILYHLKLEKISPQNILPYEADIHSTTTGFAFKVDEFLIDEDNRIVTGKVSIGGNPDDLEKGWNDFKSYGKTFALLFHPEAASDVMKNRIKILNVDEIHKTIEFNVEYGFRFTNRKWTYKYTFDNSIPYTITDFFANGQYNFVPEYVQLQIENRIYNAEIPAKANSSKLKKRDFTFYQAKNAFYNLNLDIRTPYAVWGAYRALIPYDADLSKAKLIIKGAKNYPKLMVDENSYDALPTFDYINYKNRGVTLSFKNSNFPDDRRLDWTIKIVEIE